MSSSRTSSEFDEKDTSPLFGSSRAFLPTINPAVVSKNRVLHPAVYVGAWIAISSAVILFNKQLLDGYDFHFPIFLTTWHMLFATIATQVLARTTRLLDGRKDIKMTRNVYFKAILPIGATFSLSLILSNQSYLHLSISFIQMLKATTPVAVLFATWLFGLSAPRTRTLANVSAIVFGVIIASYGKIAFNLTGFAYQTFGIVFEATRLVLIQQLLSSDSYKMDPMVSLYYLSPVCFGFNAVTFLVWEAGVMGMADIVRANILLIANALTAFALNVSVVFLIGRTSSLVLCLSGVLKDILLVLASMIFFGSTVSGTRVFGYFIALAGLVFYKIGADAVFDALEDLKAMTRSLPRKIVILGVGVLTIFVITLGMLLPQNDWSSSNFVPWTDSGYGAVEGPPTHYLSEIPKKRPFLDLNYQPPAGVDFDIIISMYKEDPKKIAENVAVIKNLEPLKELNTRIIIYVKNQTADKDEILRHTNASSVKILPNLGREGATYLHHIINRWDNLATHTLFLQGDIHNLERMCDRITDYFVPETGMLSVGFGHNSCDRDICHDPWNGSEEWTWIPKIYTAVYNESPPPRILLSYSGQFIASARRIRGTEKCIYEELDGILESGMDHWIHNEKRGKMFKDRPDNPYFGHTIERSWAVILQCADPRLAQTCPKLRDRRKKGDRADKCQCLDVNRSLV